MSENLKRFFGFPQIHLNQDLKPEIENNSNLMSENYDNLDLKVLPNDKKKSRKQSFNSGSIRNEVIEDVNIKTEAKDVETDFPGHYLSGYNDENITEDTLDSKIKVENANKNDSIDIPKSDIICTICNKKLISKHQLRKHMRSKHNLGYECSICKKKLPSKLTLKQHKTNEHKTVHGKSDLCPLCGKAFKDPNYLQQHISEVCNNQWKGNKCLMCNETFESRLFTIEHIAAKHQDVKLYDCSDCSSRFLSEKI